MRKRIALRASFFISQAVLDNENETALPPLWSRLGDRQLWSQAPLPIGNSRQLIDPARDHIPPFDGFFGLELKT